MNKPGRIVTSKRTMSAVDEIPADLRPQGESLSLDSETSRAQNVYVSGQYLSKHLPLLLLSHLSRAAALVLISSLAAPSQPDRCHGREGTHVVQDQTHL